MSLLYIIDGYNVIKRSPLFNKKRLKDARDSFFSYLDHHRPQGSSNNRLLIVFDGVAEVFGFKEDYSFEVIFTRTETADEKIKEEVMAAAQPKNIVVVTDDKKLAFSVRQRGAQIMGTDDFLDKRRKTKRANLCPTEYDLTKAELDLVQKEAITEELKQLWLKKKS